MEKIFASYSYNGRLISRMYKGGKLITKITNNPINKWSNELNRYFLNEEKQMTNKYVKNVQNL
jgi:hypothetical protein